MRRFAVSASRISHSGEQALSHDVTPDVQYAVVLERDHRDRLAALRCRQVDSHLAADVSAWVLLGGALMLGRWNIGCRYADTIACWLFIPVIKNSRCPKRISLAAEVRTSVLVSIQSRIKVTAAAGCSSMIQ